MTRSELYAFVRSILPDAIAWSKQAFRRMDEANVRLYAAAIAYRTIFSLIAFVSTGALIAVMLGIEPGEIQDTTGGGNIPGASGEVESATWQQATETINDGNPSALIAGIIGFLVGLWTLSGGFAALCDILDRVHGVHVYRTMTWRYLRGAGRALLFLVMSAIGLFALLVTTGIGDAVFGSHGLDFITSAWKLLFRAVVPTLMVFVTFAYVLRYGSHARPPWGQVIPGSIVGSALWLLLLGGFAAYINFFNGFETYGTLATAIAILFFGYLSGYIVILLALFRQEIAWLVAIIPGLRRAGDGSSIEFHIPGITDRAGEAQAVAATEVEASVEPATVSPTEPSGTPSPEPVEEETP